MHVVALIRRIWNKKLAISKARYPFKGISFTYGIILQKREKSKGIRRIIRIFYIFSELYELNTHNITILTT